RRALVASERLDPRNELLEAELLTILSVAYYQVDEFARAGAFLERAVAIFEREGQHEDVARAHRNFARFAAASGHYSKALAAVGRAEALVGTAEWESGLAHVRLGRAVVLGENGQWPMALAEATAVRDELHRRGLVARAAQADLVRARALRALAEPAAATEAA